MPTEIRPSMTDILTKIRSLVGDQPLPDSSGTLKTVFSDEELQEACDERREDVAQLELAQKPFQTTGGTLLYTQFYAQWKGGWWESDAFLQDAQNNVVAAQTVDYHLGRWIFASQPTYPIFLNGVWYDTYAISADILETWAAREKLNFDIQLDYQQFRRNQKFQSLLEMANTYRMKQRPITAKLVRTDVAPRSYGPGVTPTLVDPLSIPYKKW